MRKNDYYQPYEVRFDPIPAWADLSVPEYRVRVRTMVDEIIAEGLAARQGKGPLGAKTVMRMPLDRRSELPEQPWFERRRHMICWADPRCGET